VRELDREGRLPLHYAALGGRFGGGARQDHRRQTVAGLARLIANYDVARFFSDVA